MNIVIIAQCQKNALKETRRILDQFAERKGERTWQTAITLAGLNTLRKLLRQRARRNTAVACHWIRGLDHSELLWIVGDASRFNQQGTVPTNLTRRNIVRREDEDHWHSLDVIHWLASMAALLHDLGKATDAFQQRLRGTSPQRNRYRHEWASLRLLEAFIGQDSDSEWLTRLASAQGQQSDRWQQALKCDGMLEAPSPPSPFHHLPPLAQAIGWLIISHHRLPLAPCFEQGEEGYGQRPWGSTATNWPTKLAHGLAQIDARWNDRVQPQASSEDDLAPWWHFSVELPVADPEWHQRAQRLVQQAFKASWWRDDHQRLLASPYIMHRARLCLMMADHHYSSLAIGHSPHFKQQMLYANTRWMAPAGQDASLHRGPNQTLLNHLMGVTRATGEVAHRLPSLTQGLRGITQHRPFRQRSRDARFRWQDHAYDLAVSLQQRSEQQGFFGVNMASTGCGKTLANGRIMYGLAHPRRGARFTIALGLRTLTLQTGRAYRRHLKLSDDDLAIRVGGSAQMTLFEHGQTHMEHPATAAKGENTATKAAPEVEAFSGSSSAHPLISDDSQFDYTDQRDPHPLLHRFIHDPRAQQFISAPIMTCTIDHLMPATESLRGGHQIAPMLRLMTSDLVLDEPDDFDIKDFPALTRLVYWTGLCGARVMLSSATLPPFMVCGLFEAYRQGRQEFQQHQGDPAAAPAICAAWFDEQHCSTVDCHDSQAFRQAHHAFTKRRISYLANTARQPSLRVGRIISTDGLRAASLYDDLAALLLAQSLTLHQAHHGDSPTQQAVSFGLIRMANINPLVEIAHRLLAQQAPAGVRVHLCIYHSQFPLLMRSRKEQLLDGVLDRHDIDAVYQHPAVAPLLAADPDKQHLFIVLGSPVTEVGRDHDYDWAIVEPSSIRSIIQLAGRVQRHRQASPTTANIALLNQNVSALQHKPTPFSQPGFEGKAVWKLPQHKLDQGLLPTDFLSRIDARPRLELPAKLTPPGESNLCSLSSLEHQRIGQLMLPDLHDQYAARARLKRYTIDPAAGAFSVYRYPYVTLTGLLPQHQRFREQAGRQIECVFLFDEDTDQITFHAVQEDEAQTRATSLEYLLAKTPLPYSASITPWGDTDYARAVTELADSLDITPRQCAWRFGRLTLRDIEQDQKAHHCWAYHPVMGFSVRK